MAKEPSSRSALKSPVTPVRYAPPKGYALDIEVYPVAELRRRAGNVEQRGFERADFHCLIYVSAGSYMHVVDFELLDCTRGSLIVLQPGQVHHFGDLSGCDGWALILRSEVLPSRAGGTRRMSEGEPLTEIGTVPTKLSLPAAAQSAVEEAFERMASDAACPSTRAVNALLRSQLEALVIRLHMEGATLKEELVERTLLQRFRRYRALIEHEFTRWHSVARFAQALGCSERSLSRAAHAVADRSAKAILSDRIVLEAKRLLAHSALPVANIGYELGFSEPTNFVKFFSRETRLTPGAFREQMSKRTQSMSTSRQPQRKRRA